jgi:hypothetical protein
MSTQARPINADRLQLYPSRRVGGTEVPHDIDRSLLRRWSAL